MKNERNQIPPLIFLDAHVKSYKHTNLVSFGLSLGPFVQCFTKTRKRTLTIVFAYFVRPLAGCWIVSAARQRRFQSCRWCHSVLSLWWGRRGRHPTPCGPPWWRCERCHTFSTSCPGRCDMSLIRSPSSPWATAWFPPFLFFILARSVHVDAESNKNHVNFYIYIYIYIVRDESVSTFTIHPPPLSIPPSQKTNIILTTLLPSAI